MLRSLILCVALLSSGGSFAQDALASKNTWLGTTPMFLGAMLQVEAERKLDETSGLFAQGRWWVAMTDGFVAGGQVAWRHHFSSHTRGFFIGPYLDMNRFEYDGMDDEIGYSASILVLGGHWGGRYTFQKGGYVGFRIGAGLPLMTEFDRKHSSNALADTLTSILDKGWLQPALVSYSVVDASLSFGYAF